MSKDSDYMKKVNQIKIDPGTSNDQPEDAYPMFDLSSLTLQDPELWIPKWCTRNNVPIFTINNPAHGEEAVWSVQYRNLNKGDRVIVTQQPTGILWSEITFTYYVQEKNRDEWDALMVTGWVRNIFLDDHNQGNLPTDVVNIERQTVAEPAVEDQGAADFKYEQGIWQTNDPTDHEQDMMKVVHEKKMVEAVTLSNMCGELCVAFLYNQYKGNTDSIQSVLKSVKDKWTAPSRPTFAPELIDLLLALGFKKDEFELLQFNAFGGWDKTKDEKIKTHYLIANVKIDGAGGLISQNMAGAAHWVVVDRVTRRWTHTDENGNVQSKGINGVLLYNPSPNKMQEYSYNEFLDSCSKSFIWVKRPSPLVDDASPIERPFEVQLDWGEKNPRPEDYRAEQYINREPGEKTGEKKNDLCGELCVAYVLTKSIDGAVRHWKESPPDVKDQATILKAYGYYTDIKDNKYTKPKSFTIGTVLDHWRATQPKLYEYHVKIWGGVKKGGTGSRELKTILQAYGYNNEGDIMYFQTGLTDKLTDASKPKYLPTPGRMKERLKDYFLITGVGIDGLGALITGDAIRHWVVVEKIEPLGTHIDNIHSGDNGGWVELYNPFTNLIEEYSYMELTQSMGSDANAWEGLWVKRDVKPVFTPQDIMYPVVEGKDGLKKSDENPAIRWKKETLVFDINKKLKNDIEPDKITKDKEWVERTGWSADEINKQINKIRGIPDIVTANPVDNIKEQVIQSLAVDIDEDVISWLRKISKGDISFAVQLAKAMKDDGILILENNVYSIKYSPKLSADKIYAVLDKAGWIQDDQDAMMAELAKLVTRLDMVISHPVDNIQKDIKEKVIQSLAVNIDENVLSWIDQTSERDTASAAQLAKAMKESGILIIEKDVYNIKDSNANQAAKTDLIGDHFTSQPGSPTSANVMMLKVANTILPGFTSQVIKGIKEVKEIKDKELRENENRAATDDGSSAKLYHPVPVSRTLYKVRIWGDEKMVKYSFTMADFPDLHSNFMPVPLYNENGQGGGTDKRVTIYREQINHLKSLQPTDDPNFTVNEKMNWLAGVNKKGEGRSRPYLMETGDDWKTAHQIYWQAIVYGGWEVEVINELDMNVDLPNFHYTVKRMCEISLYDMKTPKPNAVQHATAVNAGNKPNYTPRGIILAPIWKGPFKYIPKEWLDIPGS